MADQKINCPNCGHPFAVEEVLEKQVQSRLEKEFAAERNSLTQTMLAKEKTLAARMEEFERKRKESNEIFQKRLDDALIQKEQELKNKIDLQNKDKLAFFQKEMNEKDVQIKKLREAEISILREKTELQRVKDEMELKVEKEMLEARQAIEEKARKEEAERQMLKMREYEKKMDDLKTQLTHAQQKAEQGSMQLQGEVLELILEEELRRLFPYDEISEVGKGIKGADVIQNVKNHLHQECGQIIYETKRTKTFSSEWIEKLKMDQRRMGAEMAVIVTEAMPKDMDNFGEIKGVWICNFKDFKGVALMLREALIRIHDVRESQVNKGDKMELLYSYLTGAEFKGNLEAIVEGFNQMQSDLDRERKAMERIWKSREKQIEKVVKNTIHMYGSIKGIAGSAVSSIQQLELPEDPLDQLENI